MYTSSPPFYNYFCPKKGPSHKLFLCVKISECGKITFADVEGHRNGVINDEILLR
jgi:hypothetical protein